MFLSLLKIAFLIPILMPNYCSASPVGDDFKDTSLQEMNTENSSKPIEIKNVENFELNSKQDVNQALVPQQNEYLRQQRQSSFSQYSAPIQQYSQLQQQQYVGLQQPQYSGIQQPQYSEIQQPQYQGIQQAQYPQIKQYGYAGVPQEYPEVQQSYPTPEWYTGLQQGYQSPQQSVYSSNPFAQSLSCLYSIYKAGGDLCGLRSYPQMCRYKNPCVLSPGKYLKVIGNSQYFVQCDNNASAYCKSCGPGTVWDQDLYTCNYPTATNY